LLKKEKKKIVVILITNRENVLDPAFYRRASLHLKFERPNRENREKIFKHIFQNVKLSESVLKELLSFSEKKPPYTYSDLIQKVGTQALFKAIELNKPFSPEIYLDTLNQTEATPLII
jgi:SpoVK/Ycf46/Vps4 family AAA+-type ATPase